MMRSRVLVLGTVFMIMQWGCGNRSATPEEYIAYINNEKNGLTQIKEVGPYLMAVQYRPLSYEVLNSIGIDRATEQSVAKALLENSGLEYYLLRIASKDKKTDALANGIDREADYERRIAGLVSGIETRIKLVINKDTFPCMMHHYERNYQMADFHNILLVFETGKAHELNEDKLLLYNDDILGIGKIGFKIYGNDIKNIPQLIL